MIVQIQILVRMRKTIEEWKSARGLSSLTVITWPPYDSDSFVIIDWGPPDVSCTELNSLFLPDENLVLLFPDIFPPKCLNTFARFPNRDLFVHCKQFISSTNTRAVKMG